MDKDIQPFVIYETLVEDHRSDNLRAGEGCIVSLSDDSLLHLCTRFKGPRDEAPTALMACRSTDGGVRWTPPDVFRHSPEDCLNIMSVSMLPLQDGRLAGVYLYKKSTEECRPVFMTSSDNGCAWTEPVHIIDRPGYYVVNNDRLVQLSGGRLLVPYAWRNPAMPSPWNVFCGCAISDEAGATWHLGQQELQIESDHVRQPKLMDDTRPDVTKDVREGRVACQEPGVIELLDGRVLMWCRTPGGYAYRAVSEDRGETWSPFKPLPEFAMPCGPQSIKRLPGSNRLIMLFNDREGVPYGHPQFHWRRPLTVAVSDDDAQTWQRHGLLEADTVPSNCYYSICFHHSNVVFAYYEGVMETKPNGLFAPRNLASLKLKIVSQHYFAS